MSETLVCRVADEHELKTYQNWFLGGDVCGLQNRKNGRVDYGVCVDPDERE